MRRQVLFVGLICVAFLVNAQEEKTIDLDEVTIQASSIIRKKDRQLIFPSKDQVRRSMDGLDLTRRMSLPRLWVDPKQSAIYVPYEQQARDNGRGLWQGQFYKPWDWREIQSKKPKIKVIKPKQPKKSILDF